MNALCSLNLLCLSHMSHSITVNDPLLTIPIPLKISINKEKLILCLKKTYSVSFTSFGLATRTDGSCLKITPSTILPPTNTASVTAMVGFMVLLFMLENLQQMPRRGWNWKLTCITRSPGSTLVFSYIHAMPGLFQVTGGFNFMLKKPER